MKTKNILSIDIVVKPHAKIDWIDMPIHVSKTPKNWQRTETCKKILKLINEKI